MANVYETVKQAIGDVLAPQLEEIKGELKAVRSEIARVDAKIDKVDTKLTMRIDSVETKLSSRIDAVETKLSGRIDAKLDFRIDGVITRIDSLGKEVAHIRELINVEKRLAVLETRLP
jgi:chromosome segregation ATPase